VGGAASVRCHRREFEAVAKLFPALTCLRNRCAYRPSDLSRHLHSFSDNEATNFVASLIFLMASAFGMEPIPCDPSEITALDDPHSKVNKNQMAVTHGAEVKERRPGHCGISREASMACRAASCSASWRRRSSAKRKSMIRTPHMSQPTRFQRTGGQN